MQFTKVVPADSDREFEFFRAGDASSAAEIWTRNLIILSCAVMLWLASDQGIMLVWGLGYVVLNCLYAAFLRRKVMPVRRRHLFYAMAASVFLVVWYGAMVVYVSTLGDGAFFLLAASGCVALALQCLSRNQDFSYAAIIDLTATVVTSLGVLINASLMIEPVLAGIATLIGGISVVSYFIIGFREIVQERQRLHRRLMAEKQDDKMRALGQFTSGVAHDFNNLLTVVNGNIELAKLDPDGIEGHRYLEEAHAAGLKGAVLIQQLLAFARKSQINVSDINIADMLGRVQGLLNRVLPAHVNLTVGDSSPALRVRGDIAMVESALINLVINARDALGKQSGDIRIEVTALARGEVEIAVCDTGPGMDEKTLARATEPFFTTKAVGEGSGLGLSMVSGVAAQCGGRLDLRNRAKGGLCARIILPMADLDTAQGSSPDHKVA